MLKYCTLFILNQYLSSAKKIHNKEENLKDKYVNTIQGYSPTCIMIRVNESIDTIDRSSLEIEICAMLMPMLLMECGRDWGYCYWGWLCCFA